MAVLGIITCEILELEFAHILANDPEVESVTILENEHSTGLATALDNHNARKLRLIKDLGDYCRRDALKLEALVRVMEVGLHTSIKTLRQEVASAAAWMGSHVDAILLGYGLCGNAIEKPEILFAGAGVPVFLPMDDDHHVDDCVGLIIGGRENYYEEQCKCSGTMFMNAGFARHWKKLLGKAYGGTFEERISKRLFAGYKRSLVLPTPVLSEEEIRNEIKEFNDMHSLETEVRSGTLELLQTSWTNAKHYVSPRQS
jgi:hypothetical protein